jgi:hypothetical protein
MAVMVEIRSRCLFMTLDSISLEGPLRYLGSEYRQSILLGRISLPPPVVYNKFLGGNIAIALDTAQPSQTINTFTLNVRLIFLIEATLALQNERLDPGTPLLVCCTWIG